MKSKMHYMSDFNKPKILYNSNYYLLYNFNVKQITKIFLLKILQSYNFNLFLYVILLINIISLIQTFINLMKLSF